MDILDQLITIKRWGSHLLSKSNYIPFAIIIGGFSLGFFSFIIGIYALITVSNPKRMQANTQPQSTTLQEKQIEPTQENMVEVAGAVQNPGVYSFQPGERVVDAIDKAGGLEKKADVGYLSKNLNRAAKLQDEEKIYIPFIGEKYQFTVQALSSIANQGSREGTGVVNINSASLDEIMKLEGIGEVRAQKIISNRPYSSLEELVDKDVLTSKLFSNIKSQVAL